MTDSSPPIRVAIAGATGRMGQMLIEAVRASGDCQLAGALDRADSPALGQDAGAFAGWASGVPVQAALDAPGLTLERIRAIHAEAEKAMERTTGRMLKETRYGADHEELAKWNHQVYLALGVDSILLIGDRPQQQ